MNKILNYIEELGEGKYQCYKTRKLSLDISDSDILDYDDKPVIQTHNSNFAESDMSRVKTVQIPQRLIKLCDSPLFSYFLDGMDDLVVETQMIDVGAAVVKIEQKFVKDDVICAIINLRVAYLGADMRPKRIPGQFIDALM